MTETHSGG